MIEDRPVSELEVDCIVEAQMKLQKDPIYKKIVAEKEALKSLLCKDADNDKKLSIEKFNQLCHEVGFWNGEAFCICKMIKATET